MEWIDKEEAKKIYENMSDEEKELYAAKYEMLSKIYPYYFIMDGSLRT